MIDNRFPAPAFINPPVSFLGATNRYLSAVAPTAIIKSFTLYNNNDVSPVLKSNMEFYNISTDFSIPENNWYLNPDVLPQLRVRTIISLSAKTSNILDFLVQRFNEFQARRMKIFGNENAPVLLESLTLAVEQALARGGESDAIFQLELFDAILSSDGPFNGVELTRKIKNSTIPYLDYSSLEDNIINDVIVHDTPLENFILFDKENNVITKPLDSVPSQAGALPNRDAYNAEIVSSKGFQIKLSEIGIESFTNQNISVYSFCYYDYEAFLERYDSILSLPITSDTSVIQTGIGFIDSKTFFGDKVEYENQAGDILVGPTIARILEDPDSTIFSDVRDDQYITPENLRNKLQDTFYSTMVGAIGIEKTISQIMQSENYFSDLWICKDQSENTRYSFAFDIAAFLAENSPFPFLYVSQGTASELLNGGTFIEFGEASKIVSLRFKKRRIEKNSFVSTNDLSVETSKRFKDDRLGFEKYIGEPIEIRNLFLAEGQTNNIKLYEGLYLNGEERRTQADVDCQYGVDVLVHDSSLVFLTRVQTAFNTAEQKIRNIYESIITSPPGDGIYNKNSRSLTTPLLNIPFESLNAQEFIDSVIDFYVLSLDNFGVIRSETLEIFKTNIKARISTGDVEAIKNLADIIRTFSNELNSLLRSYYPTNTKVDGSVQESKIETSRTSKNLLITKEHYFKETSDYGKHYGSGYSYLTNNQPSNISSLIGLSRLSKNSHLARASTEFSKYFNTEGSSSPNALSFGYADSSISYYSPLQINIFGKDGLNQTALKIENENAVDYDFNNYAELLLDILNLNKNKLPFHNLNHNDIGSSLEESLIKKSNNLFHMISCNISDQAKSHFEELTSKNINDDMTTTVDRKNKPKDAPGVGSTLLGGEKDQSTNKSAQASASTESVVKELEDALVRDNFSNLTKEDETEQLATKKKNLPTKIVFNIIGELLVNGGINETNNERYQDIKFNSLTMLASMLGANSQNIEDLLSSPEISQMPNQLKSMIVISTMNQGLSLGNGFDAVRPKLKDKLEITGDKYISAVFNDLEYPPYERTGDPMKTYAKMLAFWMNYKQLVCVEYLAGFSSVSQNAVSRYYLQKQGDDEYYYKTKRPIWKKFTQTFYENNIDKKFLCRLRPISDLDFSFSEDFINKFSSNSFISKGEIFDLPIYNKYFLLNGNTGD